MGEENKTRDAVDAVTGLVKAVPVYQDVVQPAAKEIGVGLQKTVQLALAPISGLVWGFDKIKDFVGTSVAKRLEKVSPEKIITPLPQIAGPALEALKYTGHDEKLREMFAKLLATAMDEKTATTAHPSFVEIIRQLSSDEAKICHLMKKQGEFVVVSLFEEDNTSYRFVVENYSTLGYAASCQFPTKIQEYLGNLSRLGLLEIVYHGEPVEIERYKELEEHLDFREALERIAAAKCKPVFERGDIGVTAFGEQFMEACVD